MIDPRRVAAAQRALGHQLARLREASGCTQTELAAAVLTSRSTVANVETGHSRGTRDFWNRADTVLHAQGELLRGYADVQALQTLQRQEAARASAATRVAAVQGSRDVALLGPDATRLSQPPERAGGSAVAALAPADAGAADGPQVLLAAGGRFFDGLDIEARVYPAVDDGRILTAVPAGYVHDRFLRRNRRGLIIGVTDHDGQPQAFGLDSRHARRKLSWGSLDARLIMPRAYALDHLTLGILWAVANLDDGLLHDDATLAELQQQLTGYATLPESSVSPDVAEQLSTVSRMWLGSDFCARHIIRHLADAPDVPMFWTREQRGEEASTWLLFAHKYAYLEAVTDRFGGRGLSRAFCIPPDTVAASPPSERSLLLLAVALMESFGITVYVCTEPEYATVDGFVLDRGGRAIVANWIGAEGIWHATVTTDRPSIRDYTDITGHARAHSAAPGYSPAARLRSLAAYLDLDWAWLTGRCAELAEQGCAGIAEPRSRLLSVTGLDRACRHLAELATIAD